MYRAVMTALAVTVALTLGVPASAQETRGSIEGAIKDATGGMLPGVTVQAKQAATAATQQTVTDSMGNYRFPALSPGTYEISATLSGFSPASVGDVRLDLGKILKVDLTMALAGFSVTETVQAESPIVDVKQNAVTVTVTKDLIDLLPKDRNFLSALTGIAGLNDETRGGGIMIDGASGSENRILIDGQDTTNLRTGTSGKDVVVDFIEQIQVKQSGYDAQYRATTGGVVSAITRSGTNSYRGDVSLDYDGKKMNRLLGDIRPTLRLVPNVPINPPAEYLTTPRTTERERERYDPTLTFGGPILRNRAWFFVGVNPSVRNQDRTVQWLNPTVNGVTYPAVQTFNDKDVANQYTWNTTITLTNNLRARVSGTHSTESDGLALPGVDATTFTVDSNGNTLGISNSNASLFNPRSTLHTERSGHNYAAAFDWNVGANTYANVTGGYYSRNSGSRGGQYYEGIRRVFSGTNIGYLDVPAELQHPANYADNISNSYTAFDNEARFSINGDVTRYLEFKGQHAIKAGMQLERIYNDVNTGQQFPNVTVVWNGTRTTLDNQQVRGTYGYYYVGRNYTVGDIGSNNIGLFFQDQWSPTQRLTINYGVRADRTRIPSYRDENPGLTFDFKDKIAPRIGFAYDIKGDSRWKAYGSWGVFYDIEKLEMPRGLWGAEHWNDHYWTLDSFNWPAIDCDGTPNSGCPGTFIESFDRRHVANDANNNLTDPNLKPVKTQELVFGADHELNRVTSVGVRYVHKWLNRTIEDVGVLVPGIGEVFYMSNPGYGFGAYPNGTDFPRTPFPKRDYDALEFNYRRRLANNWSLNTNISFSRLYGNYSGLASSDENGRTSPNVNRFFDGLYMNFTERGCPDRVNCEVTYGRLGTDRPIQYKAQGTYMLPWGTAAGVVFNASSGTPQSTTVTYKTVPVMVYGRGDLGRTPALTRTDLNFQHNFRLPRNMRVSLQLNVTNLFDQNTETRYFTGKYRSSLVLPGDGNNFAPFFDGFDTDAVQAARNAAVPATSTTGKLDPRYGMADQFLSSRTARFYVRFSF